MMDPVGWRLLDVAAIGVTGYVQRVCTPKFLLMGWWSLGQSAMGACTSSRCLLLRIVCALTERNQQPEGMHASEP